MKLSSKKTIATIFAMVIALSGFSVTAYAANTANDLVTTAATEIGYTQGSDGYTKYGKYTGYTYDAWCKSFISWCAKEAGVPSSVITRYASCQMELNAFKKQGRFYDSAAHGGWYTPQKGDLIFFNWSGKDSRSKPDHIGIVEYSYGDYVYTIEGNSGNGEVRRNTYSLYDSCIVGYGVPAYDGNSSSSYTSSNTYTSTSTKEKWRINTPGGCILRSSPSSRASAVNYHFVNGKEFHVSEKVEVNGTTWGYTTSDGCGYINLSYCECLSGSSYSNTTTYKKPLVAPTLKIDVDGQTVTISWNKIESATHYDLRLYYADGSHLYDNWGGDPNETSLSFKMDPNTQYYVQVCAANDYGDYVYCNPIYFTTGSAVNSGKHFEDYPAVSVYEGIFYLSPRCAPNSCIDSEGGETLYDNYSHNTHLWTYLGNANQHFAIEFYEERDGKKLYTIKNTLTGQYLIMDKENNVTESPYILAKSKWYFIDCGNGYYKVINYFCNLALDIFNADSSNGSNAWCYDPSDMDNSAQLFKLNRVENSYNSNNSSSVNYYIYKTTTDLNVRASADPNGRKLGTLKAGSLVYSDYYITDYRGVNWWHINYNGYDAYVSGSYVTYVETVYN